MSEKYLSNAYKFFNFYHVDCLLSHFRISAPVQYWHMIKQSFHSDTNNIKENSRDKILANIYNILTTRDVNKSKEPKQNNVFSDYCILILKNVPNYIFKQVVF